MMPGTAPLLGHPYRPCTVCGKFTAYGDRRGVCPQCAAAAAAQRHPHKKPKSGNSDGTRTAAQNV